VATDRGIRLIELFAFLTMTCTFCSRSPSHPARPPRLALAALTGMVLLGLAQLVPLPYRWLELAAPVNASIYHETRGALAALGERVPSPRISIGFPGTAGAVLALLAVGAIFLAAAQLVRGRARVRLFALVIGIAAIAGSLRAIHATILSAPLGGATILGSPLSGATLMGADVAAARLEVALALAFAAFWAEVLTGSRRGAAGANVETSDRIEGRILPLARRLGAWIAVAILLAATRSLGGLVGGAVASVFLPVAAARHPRARRRSKTKTAATLFAVGVLLATLLGTVVALGPPSRGAGRSAALSRAASGIARASKWSRSSSSSWSSTLRAWREFPVLGSGLGTFPEAFARIQEGATLDRIGAPNDAAGMLVAGGAVGASLAALAVVSVGVFLARRWRDQRHREESAYALAGLGALVSLAVHGLTAPVFESVAVGILLAAVLGSACAAATESDATMF
jgi:hypothetical protein